MGSIPTSSVQTISGAEGVIMMGKNQELLRKLPKIDEMLQDEHLIFFTEIMPRQVVVETLREVIDMVRREIIDGRREEIPAVEELAGLVKQRVFEEQGKSLRRVINATGVVLHTNLGRANLSRRACESVLEAAGYYSNLEYDIKKGSRGSKQDRNGAVDQENYRSAGRYGRE